MRLLDKQEVNTQKAKEKQLEIKEGAKLANKVDVLRETFSKEQANLTKFRNETLDTVKQEISDAILRKTTLEKELAELQIEKEKLLVPLDKEWDKLKEAKMDLEDKVEDVVLKESNLQSQLTDLEDRKRKIELEKERISDMKDKAALLFTQATKNLDEKNEILKKSKEEAKEISNLLKEREKAALLREARLDYQQLDIENQKKGIELDKQDIIKTKAQLADQRATLERAFNRLQK